MSPPVGGRLGDRLTDRRLHFVRVGFGGYAVQVEIQSWLIHAVEILKIGERDESAVAKSNGLIRSQLRRGRLR
jgi:hypothetical protein